MLKLLEVLKHENTSVEDNSYGFLGIGLDSCITPTRHNDIKIVQTTDFFYPLVDDPYMQGKIACANVLSDLYATGKFKSFLLCSLLLGFYFLSIG